MRRIVNKTIVALGVDMKSRFCVLKNNDLMLSKEFGDLSDLNNFNNFKKSLLKLKFSPDIVAFDMHPGYFSSQAADFFRTKNKIAVQHHHAHIVSLLLNKNINRPVIGVAFDGTGYGSDGNLWGGEFMIVDKSGFRRLAHFKYMKMPGAEMAVKEPWRMAFSILYDCLGKDALKLNLDCLKIKHRKDYAVLIKMLEYKINSPLTSSVGRLFDAVSSILGVCHKVDFEAEAAVKLEKLAHASEEKGFYKFDILKQNNCFILGYNKFIKKIIGDINSGLPKQDIARKFHNSLVEIVVKMVDRISRAHDLRDVILSGGVFQNKILFDSIVERLDDRGYNLIYNTGVPVNDLGICMGQAYVAMNANPN